MTIADVKQVKNDALPALTGRQWNFFKYNCKVYSKEVFAHVENKFTWPEETYS